MCQGLFPLEGVWDDNPFKLRFKWFSLKLLYTFGLLGSFVFCCVTSGIKIAESEMILHELATPLFYFHISGIVLIFTKISRSWPSIMNGLHFEERNVLKKYKGNGIGRRINKILITSTVLLVGEHALACAAFYTSHCKSDKLGLEYSARKQFGFVYDKFEYNTASAMVLMVSSCIGTLVWNFGDVFIIVLSALLTSRFEQIVDRINWFIKSAPNFKKVVLAFDFGDINKREEHFWVDIRSDYDKLCQICGKVNSLLADLVLFSYSCNLCFILLQLFISLRERERIIETLYFFSSFGFVAVRTVIVSIYGGWMNEASKAALPVLNAVPTEMYNPHISRLINQMHANSPTLTGHNFFSVTKGLVLSIAGAIITYELVLIQFNQSALEKYLAKAPEQDC